MNNKVDVLNLKQLDFIEKITKSPIYKEFISFEECYKSHEYKMVYINHVVKIIQGMFEATEDYKIEADEKRNYSLSYKKIASYLTNGPALLTIAENIPISWASRVKQTCKQANVMGL